MVLGLAQKTILISRVLVIPGSRSDPTLTLSCLVTMLGKCRDMPSRYKVVIIGRDATQDIGIGIWAISAPGPGREMTGGNPFYDL